MNLSNLKPAAGSVKTRKRIGRGPGSGRGGTSTRGHKGANHARVTNTKWDSKADRCLFNGVCRSSALRISIA